MNKVLGLVMRMMGLGKAVDALDGQASKAYIGGVGQILTGVATLLGGAANVLGAVVKLQGMDQYIAYAQSLSHDPNAALVVAGMALISKGLADIGNRHALAKAAATDPAAAVPGAPATPPAGA